jgi:hypothetical protein
MSKLHIHEIEVTMTQDRERVETFLNSLEGEIIAIIPNVHSISAVGHVGVDFLWIVEREKDQGR